MPKRTFHIDQLIINSPYDEPGEHWSYDRETRLFTLAPGRRPAGYVVATEGSKSFDDAVVAIPAAGRIPSPLIGAGLPTPPQARSEIART